MSVTFYRPETLPPVNRREVLRYAGVGRASTEIDALLAECIKESENILAPRICYATFPVCKEDGTLDLGFAHTTSKALQKSLDGCQKVLVFAATLGLELDRRIARAEVTSPAKALLLQSFGAERIEALCDGFQEELKARGMETRPRVSPGYGDISLSLQADIFRVLKPETHLGLTLTEVGVMVPTKSVTALTGFVQ